MHKYKEKDLNWWAEQFDNYIILYKLGKVAQEPRMGVINTLLCNMKKREFQTKLSVVALLKIQDSSNDEKQHIMDCYTELTVSMGGNLMAQIPETFRVGKMKTKDEVN